MSHTTGQLTGTLLHPDRTPRQGAIFIAPSVPVIRETVGSDEAVLSGIVSVRLGHPDEETDTWIHDGSFTCELPASDDETLDPTGVTYTAWFQADYGRSDVAPVVGIFIPAGQTKALTELVSVEPAPVSYQQRVNDATTAAAAAADSADIAQAAADLAAQLSPSLTDHDDGTMTLSITTGAQ